MLEDGLFYRKFRDREYSLCYNTCMRMCEFIKDGDTDEVKNTYYCGLRCDHPAAVASFFRKSVRVQPDAGEACAGEQQPGFGLQPDGL